MEHRTPRRSELPDETSTYDAELQAERAYVSGLYARLDAERARVKGGYDAALLGDGGELLDRDVEVRALAKQVTRLDVADDGLCFGRLDATSGDRRYVGRIGLLDDKLDTLLLDWRAPAARPFYVATGAHPEDMRRRRQFQTRGRTVLSFTDEALGRPDGEVLDDHRGGPNDSALLAAVTMLRVYCSCPGASPMMNLRDSVAK